jgi:cytoskeleton protein RodZ
MNDTELHSDQTSAVPSTLTPGRMLAAARNEQQLTIADVANRLKLSVSQVEALENDAYDRLPGPVFVRGFIRNYARLVKLESEPFMHAANVPLAMPEKRDALSEPLEVPLQEERRWPRYAAVAALIFVIAGLIDFLVPESEPPVPSSSAPTTVRDAPAVVSQPAPTPAPSDAAGMAVGAAESASATLASTTVDSSQSPGTTSAPENNAVASSLKPSAAASPGAEAPAPHRGQLRLMFTEPSWVEIRDRDGHVILSQVNAPGTTRELSGAAPLKLVIGNARGVHVMYNERPVDLTRYMQVDVARLTLE